MKRPYRLTAAFVRSVKQTGCYGDGRGGLGLQLRVHRTAGGDVSKSWRQKLKIGGKATSVGLGSFPFVTLDDARKLAVVNAGKALSGIDPRTDAAIVRPAPVENMDTVSLPARGPTFEAAFEAVIAIRRQGWKGNASENRWRRQVAKLAFLGKPVSEVTSGDVMAAVEGDWQTEPYAARARLTAITATIKWAMAQGFRQDNPIDLVKAALPTQKTRTTHHRAVPVADAPDAIHRLRTCRKTRKLTRLAIRFQILTAARPGEAAGARWDEIETGNGMSVWSLPAERMKAGYAHQVPLSAAALEVLESAARETGNRTGLIFPGTTGNAVGSSQIRSVLRACGIDGTATGFRSTFRDWCAENGVAREVAEACLAHVVGGVEGAYFRSNMLGRRLREALAPWGEYLAQ